MLARQAAKDAKEDRKEENWAGILCVCLSAFRALARNPFNVEIGVDFAPSLMDSDRHRPGAVVAASSW
jgi:hypothetical protein